MTRAPPKVFISYRHEVGSPEHADRVLALADRLREYGIDAVLDQYEVSPPAGWPTWCEHEIQGADFVLMVCTEAYHRCIRGDEQPGAAYGVLWEARIIKQMLYDAGSKMTKLIPVLFSDDSLDHIPIAVKGATHYVVDTLQGFEDLFRHLTDRPKTRKPKLGTLRKLPERVRQWRDPTAHKDISLSAQDAFMLGAFAGSRIMLIPEISEDDDQVKEFFEYLDRLKIDDMKRFPTILRWKQAYSKHEPIVSKDVIMGYVDELDLLVEVVKERSPEHLAIYRASMHISSASLLAAIGERADARRKLHAASVVFGNYISPHLKYMIDRADRLLIKRKVNRATVNDLFNEMMTFIYDVL